MFFAFISAHQIAEQSPPVASESQEPLQEHQGRSLIRASMNHEDIKPSPITGAILGSALKVYQLGNKP
jgi:hypothetical protein